MVTPATPVITAPADLASVSGSSVSLEATVTDPDSDDVYAVWELWTTSTNGTVLDSFASPGASPIGLSHDGTNLWHCDSGTGLIYKLDPADGTVISSFASPGAVPLGLSHDGTNLWNCDPSTGLIYKLDPADGTVIS